MVAAFGSFMLALICSGETTVVSPSIGGWKVEQTTSLDEGSMFLLKRGKSTVSVTVLLVSEKWPVKRLFEKAQGGISGADLAVGDQAVKLKTNLGSVIVFRRDDYVCRLEGNVKGNALHKIALELADSITTDEDSPSLDDRPDVGVEMGQFPQYFTESVNPQGTKVEKVAIYENEKYDILELRGSIDGNTYQLYVRFCFTHQDACSRHRRTQEPSQLNGQAEVCDLGVIGCHRTWEVRAGGSGPVEAVINSYSWVRGNVSVSLEGAMDAGLLGKIAAKFDNALEENTPKAMYRDLIASAKFEPSDASRIKWGK